MSSGGRPRRRSPIDVGKRLPVPDTKIKLSEEERVFCTEYVDISVSQGKTLGAALHAIRRAFPQARATPAMMMEYARKILARQSVQDYILHLQTEISMRSLVKLPRLQEELERIAFANWLDYGYVDDKGQMVIDLRGMDPSHASAIAEIEVTELFRPRGRKTKIKLHDKNAAIDKLVRILGGYNDTVTVKNITREDIQAAIEKMKQRLREQGIPIPGEEVPMLPAREVEYAASE